MRNSQEKAGFIAEGGMRLKRRFNRPIAIAPTIFAFYEALFRQFHSHGFHRPLRFADMCCNLFLGCMGFLFHKVEQRQLF